MNVRMGEVIKKRIDELKLWRPNPRSITKANYEKLKESIRKQGFHDVLKLAADGETVLGGNHRLRALRDLGIKEVNCVVTDAKTEKEMFEVAITDNMQYADYEKDALAELMFKLDIPVEDLEPLEVDLGDATSLLEILNETGPSFDDEEDKKGKKPREVVCPSCGEEFEI